jgi:hypothetical protein
LTLATASRVLAQLRNDHRSVALMLVAPLVLLTLLRFVFDDAPQVFDRVGGPLLALFPFVTMFLVTSVAMLRERSSGTLERLLAMPLGKGDLLGGYALAFGSVAVVQTLLASALCLGRSASTSPALPRSWSCWPSSTPCSARRSGCCCRRSPARVPGRAVPARGDPAAAAAVRAVRAARGDGRAAAGGCPTSSR